MADTFIIKEGATLPTLDYTLQASIDGADPAVITEDISGATVVFVFRPKKGGTPIEVAGSVQDAAAKVVRADIKSDTFNVDQKTTYDYQVEVTLASGEVLVSPSEGYETAIVWPDI